jgi:hypothetical protein
MQRQQHGVAQAHSAAACLDSVASDAAVLTLTLGAAPTFCSLFPPFPPCSTIYNMCTQKPPYDYSEQLYQRYKDAFNTYINDMVRGAHLFSFFFLFLLLA